MDIIPFSGDAAGQPETVVGSATPDDLHIQSRNRHFGSEVIENKHWAGGDPYATAFFNAMSVIFPKGETFFIEVLKQFLDQTPEKLHREIRAFIQQEAVHSREHLCFNNQLAQSDYDLSRLEASINDVIKTFSNMPLVDRLAGTICLEHITAILGAELLSNPAHLKDADKDQRNLWLWHCSEEVEHKGVAYDTWLYATRDWSRARRWATKSLFMARISLSFAKNRTKGVLDLLRQDGIPGPRAWLGFARYALVSPAPFRRTLVPWFKFFLPGFHPWNIDDRYLIQLAESEFEAAVMDQAESDGTVTKLEDRRKNTRLPKVA